MSEEEAKRKPGRPRVTVCKRGHDQTADGVRNASGACVPCRKAYYEERKAALPPRAEEPKKVIPADIIEALKELQVLSAKTRRTTPIGHEFRKAGDLLAEMAVNAMNEYDVSPTALSVQMGLCESTMRHFLMRREAIEVSPSMKQFVYKNEFGAGRVRVSHCKQGHDIADAGGRYSDGSCRECKKERGRRYYYGKKDAA